MLSHDSGRESGQLCQPHVHSDSALAPLEAPRLSNRLSSLAQAQLSISVDPLAAEVSVAAR